MPVNPGKDTILQGSVFKPLIRFAIPLMLSTLLQALYGAVDLIVVGKFGTTSGVSAVSTGSGICSRACSPAHAGRHEKIRPQGMVMRRACSKRLSAGSSFALSASPMRAGAGRELPPRGTCRRGRTPAQTAQFGCRRQCAGRPSRRYAHRLGHP